MKTRDIVFYATLAVAALAMAGCEKSNDMPQESGPGDPAEIRPQPLSANGILTTNSSR